MIVMVQNRKYISVNWRIFADEWRKSLFSGIYVFAGGIFVTLFIFLYAFLFMQNIAISIGMIFLAIFFGILLVHLYRYWRSMLKNNFAKKFLFLKDGMKVVTVGGKTIRVKFRDIGLIDFVAGIRNFITYYQSWMKIIYYNDEIRECAELLFDRKNGRKIIERYLTYCRENNLKPCPILEGYVETDMVQERAKERMMNSPFCNRGEGSTTIPPPPWIMEGGR